MKLTKNEIVKELVKCGKGSSSTLLTTIAKFLTLSRTNSLLRLMTIKGHVAKDFNDYRFNVILKARTAWDLDISAAYVAWFMLFHREKNVLVIATNYPRK